MFKKVLYRIFEATVSPTPLSALKSSLRKVKKQQREMHRYIGVMGKYEHASKYIDTAKQLEDELNSIIAETEQFIVVAKVRSA